jgi:hypothetical protein
MEACGLLDAGILEALGGAVIMEKAAVAAAGATGSEASV